jgi:hypothetical protein
LLGAGHPELALSLNNLAVVLASRGATAEAARTYERALAILSRTVGPRHPHYVACKQNLDKLERPATVRSPRSPRRPGPPRSRDRRARPARWPRDEA